MKQLRSGVLVLGPNSVQSLLPSTLISQAESLLESHQIQDAVNLADRQQQKLQAKLPVNEDEAEELRYVYQRIGFQCLEETLFEDAGRHLLAGELDPRVLVSYFPDLRGGLFTPADSIDLFAGVVEHMPTESSVDEIIVANLVRNYSPYLPPDTVSAPPTAELRRILGITARDMLEAFLRKWRLKRHPIQAATPPAKKATAQVVDTVLAKLLALSNKRIDLNALLSGPHDVVISEVEDILKSTAQCGALSVLYQQSGDDRKLLDMWSKLASGEWVDDTVHDPLSQMFALLNTKRDRESINEWCVWLVKRDRDRTLKLLISKDTAKRKDRAEDDLAMLQRIYDADSTAGAQYLEYLVLQKRSTSRELHMKMATSYLDQMFSFLDDPSVLKLWRAKAASYASSPNDATFLSYFAATTPDSEHKRVRLKTMLLLQGTLAYDTLAVRQRLLDHRKLLAFELAIVEGKMGNHRDALQILVHELKDAVSAEIYCTLGGEVIPIKAARFIGDSYGLQQWATTLFGSAGVVAKSGTKPQPIARQKTVSEDAKKELLKVLLEVYMNAETASADRTARLLNSQAANLDVVDVISLVPPDWPLKTLSTFLSRSFRRSLHARHESQIVKAIGAGQNLEVADRAWAAFRDQGAFVEEEEEDDGEEGKEIFEEKIELRPGDLKAVDLPLLPLWKRARG